MPGRIADTFHLDQKPKARAQAGGVVKMNKAYCSNIADAILAAFDWEASPEGYEYWNSIHSRFKEMAAK